MDQVLSSRLAVFRNNCARMEQQLDNERQTVVRLTNKIAKIKEDSVLLVKAVTLIDKCIEVISANGVGKIESIVSAGMHKVFGDTTLGLVVEKNETARGYSYRILIRHGDTIGNAMDSFGGGIQNVAAFLLRVILVKRFKLAKFLALDENFSNVSAEFRPKVSMMLKTLVDDHGYTILAVTHDPTLATAATNIYKVEPPPRKGDRKCPTLRKLDRDSEELHEIQANQAEVP